MKLHPEKSLRRFWQAVGAATLLASASLSLKAHEVPVVATFSILGDMAQQIGGEHVSVTSLVGPDGDNHVYQPTPADARAVAKAKVLVVNGLEFEGWMERLLEAADFKGVLVTATDGVDALAFKEGDEHHDAGEAHTGHKDAHDHDKKSHKEEHDHDHDGHKKAHKDEHDHNHDGHKKAHKDEHDHDHDGHKKAHKDEHDHDHDGHKKAHKDEHDHDHDGHKKAHKDEHDHDHDGHKKAHKDEHDHDHDGHKKAHKDEHDDHKGHDHGEFDPHAWQDVANATIYARNIAAGLAKADPKNAAHYQEHLSSYIAKLSALDAEIKADMAKLPKDSRTVVTSHDAFQYFGNAYGLTFLAPQGLSTESEASAQDVANLIRQIRKEKIKAVFVENLSDSRLIERIAEETGAKVGGTLYPGALSAAGGPAPTYLDMMRENARVIRRALE